MKNDAIKLILELKKVSDEVKSGTKIKTFYIDDKYINFDCIKNQKDYTFYVDCGSNKSAKYIYDQISYLLNKII